MRRKEKQIIDQDQIDSIIKQAKVCRLGLSDNGKPYVVPLHFGYNPPFLYFHGADTGRKLDILAANAQVCFEFDEFNKLNKHPAACNWGTSYNSIIGEGTARILVEPEEKIKGLNCIMSQYSSRTHEFDPDDLAKTAVIEVKILGMTAKQSG
ncbi:pyridoxamine 5'-phosphate oxidase family protein [uncultured Desulfobacter sp.]|uniref:pyridoxamine 5'-phosphate oxidase family protein n=1 Tax=uncultured Desulfobacter sp. TaxID=240139 RepID=UPI0029F5AA91|nr:pyridoxamine 5'-phosphate oxidase family protein [uncultured Desulfobacter sp.]